MSIEKEMMDRDVKSEVELLYKIGVGLNVEKVKSSHLITFFLC